VSFGSCWFESSPGHFSCADGAVLSIARGRNLSGWFQFLGITVDRAKAQIEMK